ncbi:MAG: hypothetical protein ABI253_05015, partial [Mycobacterium sp.]
TTLGPTGQVEWIPPPALERGQPRVNPYHFIDDVINHLRGTQPADTPDVDVDEQPPPDSDWPWPDDSLPGDPLPGDPEYDAALQGLQDSYDAMDLDELVRRHFPADDDPMAA